MDMQGKRTSGAEAGASRAKARWDTSTQRRFLGIGEPFATRLRMASFLGLLVFWAYRQINPLIVRQFEPWTQFHYGIPVYYGPAALLLLSLFALHRRLFHPDLRFVGNVCRIDAARGMLVVSSLYVVTYGVALYLRQPRELSMVMLYSLKTPAENVVMVISLLVLPPIVEELAFRHFLLSVLPFKANRGIAAIAIVATALFFAFQHRQYAYMTSYLLLFALGVVFARARIRSGGMVLPIALHTYAIGFALICDQVVAHYQQ
jgi:uncharacterized protein